MFLLTLVLFIFTCSAHSRWVYPVKRPGENTRFGGVKTGPCGGFTPSATRTTLTPGWNTLEFEETISHTGAPWRISLGRSGGSEADFTSCILLNHIPHNDQAVTPQSYKIRVWIPDVQCDHCILQLANPMTDKITRGTYCDYDRTQLEACQWGSANCAAGVCFSNYHSCADVTITGTQARDTFQCSQPTQWPFQVGSSVALPCNHGNCRSAAQTTRDDYTQISVTWRDGFIADNRVPAVFSDENANPDPSAPTTSVPEITTTAIEGTLPGNGGSNIFEGGASTSDDGATAAAIVVTLVIVGALLGLCYYYRDNIKEFFNESDVEHDGQMKSGKVSAALTSIQAPHEPASEWFYVDASGESVGPLSQEDFESHVGEFVMGDTLVWNSSLENWKPAGEVRAVRKLLDLKESGFKPTMPPLPAPQYEQPHQQFGDPATAHVEWQYVDSNANAVIILEEELIKLQLPADTYVWNGITVTDWTYLKDTYLWKWNQSRTH